MAVFDDLSLKIDFGYFDVYYYLYFVYEQFKFHAQH